MNLINIVNLDIFKFQFENNSLYRSFCDLLYKNPADIHKLEDIPFLPIENIDVLILDQLNSLLPTSAYELSKETIIDLAKNQRGSLLSFGFFMMVIFSSNGINTMLEMFNQSVLTKEKRNFFQQWGIAISLMFILLFLLIISSVLIIFSQLIIDFITDKNWISGTLTLWFDADDVDGSFALACNFTGIIKTIKIFFLLSFLNYLFVFLPTHLGLHPFFV